MPKGGSRVRSGPDADPQSGRSERRRQAGEKSAITTSEFSPTALPSGGRRGEAPEFPLPRIVRWNEYFEDGKKRREVDEGAGDVFREREIAIWEQVWLSPQAVAWERDSWRWHTVAEFCRLKAIVESEPESNAALVARLREYRNEIGLSPDGLKMNGWAIAPDQLAAKRAERESKPVVTSAPARRLRG